MKTATNKKEGAVVPLSKQAQDKRVAQANATAPALAEGMLDRLEGHAGEGTSALAKDNLVPLLTVLATPTCPQCDPRDPAHIKGAVAGKVWFRNAPEPMVDGDEGFLFQFCASDMKWVEWRPRGQGGFVAAWPKDALRETTPVEDGLLDAIIKKDPKSGRDTWVRKTTGNELIDTRYVYGYAWTAIQKAEKDGTIVWTPTRVPQAYVMPLSSTGHSFFKGWNTLMRQFRLPSGKEMPAWARRYHITTRQQQNAQGKWFAFSVADAGMFPQTEFNDAFDRGLSFRQSVVSGEKVAEAPADTRSGGESQAGAGGESRV